MNWLDLAAELDQNEDMISAAWAYEIALHMDERRREPLLNLALIYFCCSDVGFAAQQRLPEGFYSYAGTRAREILEVGQQVFSNDTEFHFWRVYMDYIDLGLDGIFRQIDALISERNLVPYLFLIAEEPASYAKEAKQLFIQTKSKASARERYIHSVLTSHTIYPIWNAPK